MNILIYNLVSAVTCLNIFLGLVLVHFQKYQLLSIAEMNLQKKNFRLSATFPVLLIQILMRYYIGIQLQRISRRFCTDQYFQAATNPSVLQSTWSMQNAGLVILKPRFFVPKSPFQPAELSFSKPYYSRGEKVRKLLLKSKPCHGVSSL